MGSSDKKGHVLVCPDLGPEGQQLSYDAQVRCLCYIIDYIDQFAAIPPGVRLEVIPLQWHHFGEHCPLLGIPIVAEGDREGMARLSFNLEEQITEAVHRLGLSRLVELSAGETMTWADVYQAQEA